MIQYPKIEHVTLPSVESWGINNNILKDPPKAIVTKRIDKVGDTQNINEWVDDSGDRICEGIKVYPRGVNPMVGVNYSNNGTLGGQRVKYAGNANTNSQMGNMMTQASLPYKVMRDGVFRPPVQNPRDLLPLSRQPRLLGEKFTNPGFVNFSVSRNCGYDENTKYRQIKEDVLHCSTRPTAVFVMEKPIEYFDVNYSIVDNPLQYSVHAGYKGTDRSNLEVIEPTKGANKDQNFAFATTNLGANGKTKSNEINFDTNKYIQDPIYGINVVSNPSLNINVKRLDEVSYLDEDRYIKDHLQGSFATNISGYEKNSELGIDEGRHIKREVNYTDYTTPISGYEKDNLISDEINLTRNLPTWEATTNFGDTRVEKRMEYENELHLDRVTPLTAARTNAFNPNHANNMFVNDREYKLPPTLPKGGFEGRASLPAIQRQEGVSLNEERRNFNQKVFDMFKGRQLN